MDLGMLFSMIRVDVVAITHGLALYVLVQRGKRSRLATAAIIVLMVLFLAAAGNAIIFLFPSEVANTFWTAYMMLIVLGLAFCFLSTGSALSERLFVYIMYVAVFMLTVFCSNLIVSWLLPGQNEALFQLLIRTLFSIILIVMLSVFLKDRLYRLIKGLSVHGLEITMFSWLVGISVLQNTLFSCFFIDNLVVNLIILLLLTLTVISVFVIANRIVKLTEREVEMEKEVGLRRMLENELEAEKAFVERAKAMRHDQRHHDRTVLEYLNEGKIEEAKSYLGEHDRSILSQCLVTWSNNPLVDAQLRITWRSCMSYGIDFSADVRLGEKMGVGDIDFVSVMGNLLENAIQGAMKSESPSVSVSSRISNDKLLLEIRNTFSQSGPHAEGTGLASVRHILSQYDGLLTQETCGTMFVSRVIIPLSTGRKDAQHSSL